MEQGELPQDAAHSSWDGGIRLAASWQGASCRSASWQGASWHCSHWPRWRQGWGRGEGEGTPGPGEGEAGEVAEGQRRARAAHAAEGVPVCGRREGPERSAPGCHWGGCHGKLYSVFRQWPRPVSCPEGTLGHPPQSTLASDPIEFPSYQLEGCDWETLEGAELGALERPPEWPLAGAHDVSPGCQLGAGVSMAPVQLAL